MSYADLSRVGPRSVPDNIWTRVFNQKMNVVGRHHIIEHAQTKAFLRLENQSK